MWLFDSEQPIGDRADVIRCLNNHGARHEENIEFHNRMHLIRYPRHSSGMVVGVNIWNEGFLSKTGQDDELKQMAANGVKTIRTGLLANNVDFIIQAFQRGVGSVAILFPYSGKKTWSDVI